MVKTSNYFRFDEGMNNLEYPKPNSKQLSTALGHYLPVYQEEYTTILVNSF